MAKAKEMFTIIHPQTKDGKDDKIIGMITLSKPINDVKDRIQELIQMEGIDSIQPGGRYSFTLAIAATFDVDEVWTEIKEKLRLTASPLVIIKK